MYMSCFLGGSNFDTLADEHGQRHASHSSAILQAHAVAQENLFYGYYTHSGNAVLSINNGSQKSKTNRKLLLLED